MAFRALPFAVLAALLLCGQTRAQCYDDETGIFPDDSQCDKYIECSNGKLVNVTLCADGLVFVAPSKLSNLRANCQLPFHADCGDRKLLQEPIPTQHCPR